MCMGVDPELSWALGSAPAASSWWMTATACPLHCAALCRGVSPAKLGVLAAQVVVVVVAGAPGVGKGEENT